ncbi:ATP synthase F0 subunit C [Alkalibacterium sp. s-m-22]|uniref:ATP synthase F(0) sector subunit c n=1 Tax=Alkalibacterium indicireducens TaxID=398758 RepID=A0ABP3L2D1_9LACT
METLGTIISAAHIAAAIALLNGLFTTFGQSKVVSTAIEGIARQPEASDDIRSAMFVGLAMAETSGIYGLLIAIIMLFANPLVEIFVNLL